MFAAVLCWCALALWPSLHLDLKLHHWAGCRANEGKKSRCLKRDTFPHSPNWQMNYNLEFSWLLGSTICEMDTFGRLPSSEIVTEHEVGEGGKKLTFRKHLKSSQVPYDPERFNICLEFCEVCCWRFGWAGNEAKINFGPGFQTRNLEKTNLEALPPPFPGSPSGHHGENLMMMDSRAILKSIEQSNFNSKLMIGWGARAPRKWR